MPVRIRKKYLKRLLSLISYLGKQIYNYRPITPNICPYFSLKKWKNHQKEHKKCINNKKKRNQQTAIGFGILFVLILIVLAVVGLKGLKEGKKCSVCNKVLLAQEEIPALGHKFIDGKWITEAADHNKAIEKYNLEKLSNVVIDTLG